MSGLRDVKGGVKRAKGGARKFFEKKIFIRKFESAKSVFSRNELFIETWSYLNSIYTFNLILKFAEYNHRIYNKIWEIKIFENFFI